MLDDLLKKVHDIEGMTDYDRGRGIPWLELTKGIDNKRIRLNIYIFSDIEEISGAYGGGRARLASRGAGDAHPLPGGKVGGPSPGSGRAKEREGGRRLGRATKMFGRATERK